MSRPGPARTSCLTCRRRHKKCDLRQPTCERCEKGGFECLGYGPYQDDPPVTSVVRSTRRILPKPVQDKSPSLQIVLSGRQLRNAIPDYSLSVGEQSKDIGSPPLSPESSDLSDFDASDRVITSSPSVFNTRNVSDDDSLLQSTINAGAPAATLRRMIDLYTRLPYPIRDVFQTLDLEKVMDHRYFKPPGHHEQFREATVQRLYDSKFARLVSFVGMCVLESILTGDWSQNRLHNSWIEYIEGSLKHELSLDLAPHQTHARQSAWVHVSLMKSRLMHSSNTYQLLRNTTPIFLQLVYSNPTLWSSDSDLARIPLMGILVSESHELAIFALLDLTYAMAYGMPQQVEYDTTIYSSVSSSTSHQWVHSSPPEFQLVLANINACRDKPPSARQWKSIEEWLISWQSSSADYGFTESWMTIAWYAVQESWRLVLLVYLYLAACDFPSNDPRIQVRVKQILQVVGTLKNRRPSHVNVSFFSQYLMVGICARSEAHRKIARDKLASESETKLWLMRASDFVPVLDHLWHGAAAGGRPIKWSDYIRSREAVLPVAL